MMKDSKTEQLNHEGKVYDNQGAQNEHLSI